MLVTSRWCPILDVVDRIFEKVCWLFFIKLMFFNVFNRLPTSRTSHQKNSSICHQLHQHGEITTKKYNGSVKWICEYNMNPFVSKALIIYTELVVEYKNLNKYSTWIKIWFLRKRYLSTLLLPDSSVWVFGSTSIRTQSNLYQLESQSVGNWLVQLISYKIQFKCRLVTFMYPLLEVL